MPSADIEYQPGNGHVAAATCFINACYEIFRQCFPTEPLGHLKLSSKLRVISPPAAERF